MSTPPNVPKHVNLPLLSRTALYDVPTASPAPADSPEAFINAASEWVGRWRNTHSATKVQAQLPFVLVYAEEVEARVFTSEVMFNNSLALNVGGKIVVTPPTLAGVMTRKTAATTLDELGTELLTMGLHTFPCVLVDPGSNRILQCPNGIEQTAVTLPLLQLTKGGFSVATLDAALQKFHTLCSSNPKTTEGVWAPSDSHVVTREVEQVLMERLVHFLNFEAVGSDLVVREQSLPSSGKFIALLGREQKFQRECVLDVRALRSDGMGKGTQITVKKSYSAKVMDRYATQSITRFINVRQDAGAEHGYACFYDCRTDSEDFQSVQDLAKEGDLECRLFPLEALTCDM
jgi:hypothetical protein